MYAIESSADTFWGLLSAIKECYDGCVPHESRFYYVLLGLLSDQCILWFSLAIQVFLYVLVSDYDK